MNEKQWNTCTDPQKMLKFLRGKDIDRRLRLFVCASVRLAWEQLTPACQTALEVGERFAERDASRRELTTAFRSATIEANKLAAIAEATMDPEQGAWDAEPDAGARANAAEAARLALMPTLDIDVAGKVIKAVYYTLIQCSSGLKIVPDVAHCNLLRDLFSNLIYSSRLDPRWITSTVATLAKTVYDTRDFDRLPILADALEDAGCTDAKILDHLRGPGPHVRGCWVVDLLLEQS